MSEATLYRRSLVVDTAVVTRNLALLKERLGVGSFVLWTRRPSGARFVERLAPIAEQLGIHIDDGPDEPDLEMRATQILGGHPSLTCAVSLESHLVASRTVIEGEAVSYGGRFVAPETMTVGLAPIGFADGLDRLLTGHLRVRVDGVEVPVLGRIAMDSISIDLRTVPAATLGSIVSVFGPARTGQWGVHDAADSLGISAVEIIARLSERAEVVWR